MHPKATARAVLIGLALLVSGTSLVDNAHATSLVELSQDQLIDAADNVLRGTVVETWTEPDARGLIWTVAQVEVTQTLKGPDLGDAILVSQMGGSYAGMTSRYESGARYSVGEDVVLFVEHMGNGRTVSVGAFQGKWTVRMDPHSRQEIVQRYAPRAERAYDHRFIPLPPAHKMLFLSDFEQSIAERIELGWDGQPIPGASNERLRTINRLQPEVK